MTTDFERHLAAFQDAIDMEQAPDFDNATDALVPLLASTWTTEQARQLVTAFEAMDPASNDPDTHSALFAAPALWATPWGRKFALAWSEADTDEDKQAPLWDLWEEAGGPEAELDHGNADEAASHVEQGIWEAWENAASEQLCDELYGWFVEQGAA